MRIGILHPGAMGTDLGRALSTANDVLWLSENRSSETRNRAMVSGFVEAADLTDLVQQSNVIISICPPNAAMQVANEVASIRSAGFLYIDANTVAPGTMRDVACRFEEDVVVDVALTGAPGHDNLTVWTAGPRSAEVCNLFSPTRISTRTVGGDVGQASAFKICAGLRSKVMPAIWATLIDAAKAFGPEVERALTAHLQDIGYDLDREAARVGAHAPKAWRWISEMEESAKAMSEVGMPTGFSLSASETYRRIAEA